MPSRRVCLLIDTSTSWGTGLIQGIGRHAQEVGNWLINVEPWGRYERFRVPEGWKGDGIIARINHPEVAQAIVETGLPAVNVSWYRFSNQRIAQCTGDARASGLMAAEYFLSIGFKQFAYCGPQQQITYRDEFEEAYREPIERANYRCDVYVPPSDDPRAVAWNAHLNSLVAWIKQLPAPVAILCWSAARGRQVTEACHYAGIRVPDEIAVLGGDFDDLMSRISSPPLSTIDLPAEQTGYAAAQILESMMKGKRPPKRATLFPPTRIAVRHSTDTLAIEDEMVRDALRLIRARAYEGIRVAEVVYELAVARRALEQRFVHLLGRSPAEEIRRVRIEEAKRMLVETDRSIAEISRVTGFGRHDLLSRVFRRMVGLAPSEFRRQHQRSI